MASGQEKANTQVYDDLELSLSTPTPAFQPPPPPPTPPSPTLFIAVRRTPLVPAAAEPVPKRQKQEKPKEIPAAFPWSETKRATVLSMENLRAKQISTISGDVQCKKCEQRFQIEFNLEEKFLEISTFISRERDEMHQRAPKRWTSPVFGDCRFCNQEKCVKPVIAEKKRLINWLFLLLGEMLGCCTLDHLKYFCKHTDTHRTGAKNRVLFLVYLELCKQLDPSGPFYI